MKLNKGDKWKRVNKPGIYRILVEDYKEISDGLFEGVIKRVGLDVRQEFKKGIRIVYSNYQANTESQTRITQLDVTEGEEKKTYHIIYQSSVITYEGTIISVERKGLDSHGIYNEIVYEAELEEYKNGTYTNKIREIYEEKEKLKDEIREEWKEKDFFKPFRDLQL